MNLAVSALCFVVACFAALLTNLFKKYSKLLDMVTNLSLRIYETEDLCRRVDESTGQSIHQLQKQLNDFGETYGEAAAEEMRESARAQKAFADGLNNIMSFGAGLHGRGEST